MLKISIFKKIFFYTLAFLILVIVITAFLFSQQFASFYDISQYQQLNKVFQPLTHEFQNKSAEDIIKIASAFHEKNQSFEFFIESQSNGEIIYQTPGAKKMDRQTLLISLQQSLMLRVIGIQTGTDTVKALGGKILFALVILFAAGTAGAAMFAGGITRPIRRLAEDTRRMSALEDVSPASYGNDEIGRLGSDVHSMYEKLKQTITALEKEIEREKEMEENQRYFFSAASHELKTPIAATKALAEGMLADIGDYKNHPKYLRECIKMLDGQNKIITEIIEIVNLSDGMMRSYPEQVNILELINSILPEYRALSESKGQAIEVTVDGNINCRADRGWLGRVISNVLMNAVQNSPEREAIRIWSEEKSNSTVMLCILNTGVQIDKEIMSKLFEPFYRLDKARSRTQGRSGLGLTIVKKMLDSMEIPFSLENADEGVLFTMEFAE